MYKQADNIGTIPEETIRVAQAAFPKGNVHMQMRDAFGIMFERADFKVMYSRLGQPAIAPWRLMLVTIMQYTEGLSDRQAAEAVRDRVSWKYVLGVALDDPGFDFSVLSEFRSRLLASAGEQPVFDLLLSHFKEHGLLKSGGRQRTDSTHVLAAVRTLNRLERVGETLRHALNSVAVVVPEWLQAWVPSEWFDRYGTRVDNYRLPKSDQERDALAALIGTDGMALLKRVEAAIELPWLGELPAIQTLRQVWADQYTLPPGPIQWRTIQEMPFAAQQISSPYDPDARWSTKREVEWVGYKVHLTETCDAALPHLITHVETTVATTPDDQVVAKIHEDLAAQQLIPAAHLVDTGYTDAELLATSQRIYGIDLVGPVAADPSWQARAGTGFDNAAFRVDWETHQVVCPQGQTSAKWIPGKDPVGTPIVKVHFARSTCLACPCRSQCTKSKIEPRSLTFREQAHHLALQTARQRQKTDAFKSQYAARAGIEGTLSEAIRAHDLRQARYLGLVKTHLQPLFTALAINWMRVADWLSGAELALTRTSRFAALAPS